MSSISKPDHGAERASLALLSAYQEYLMTFKLMTSQVVQRARPLIMHTCICVVGIQRFNNLECTLVKKNQAHLFREGFLMLT